MQRIFIELSQLKDDLISQIAGLEEAQDSVQQLGVQLQNEIIATQNARIVAEGGTPSTTPATADDTALYNAYVAGNESDYANEIRYGQHGRASDSGSIYFADSSQKRDPIFYFKGKYLVVLPEPTGDENAEVLKFDYPSSVDHGDTGIESFPDGAEYAVTLGAASRFMMKLASEDQNNEDIELAANTMTFANQLKQEYEKELQRIGQQK